MSRTILITGFEPFLRHRRNPTEALARAVDGSVWRGVTLAGRVLPTEYRGCEVALKRAIRDVDPEALIMFGLAANRRNVSIEALALNMDHAVERDNAGVWRWMRPIAPGGAMVRRSTLEVESTCRALKRARIPVSVSFHAGTYVCNHAFYRALGIRRRGMVTGFIHVPKGLSAMKLERALRVIVGSVVADWGQH